MSTKSLLSVLILFAFTLLVSNTSESVEFVSRDTSRVVKEEKPKDTKIASVPKTAAVGKGAVVLLLGDSLAVGMSREFVVKAKKSGYIPVTRAIVGTTTFEWNKRIKNDIQEVRPALVVVSLGTNDAVSFESVEKNVQVYSEFVQKIEVTTASVVWIGPPAISKRRIRRIEDTKKIIRNSVPIYYDSSSLDIVLTDGIHATPKGYETWMDEVWNWMIERSIVGPE